MRNVHLDPQLPMVSLMDHKKEMYVLQYTIIHQGFTDIYKLFII